MSDKREIWKEAFLGETLTKEKFELSNQGKLRKFDSQTNEFRIIKTSRVTGYPTFYIKLKNGKRAIKYLHKVIAETFLNRGCETQNVVIHVDHDKENNQVENLRWANRHEHLLHQKNNPKVVHKGRKHGYKITPDDVKEIFRLVEEGRSKAELARRFKVSATQIRRILLRKNWNNIEV
ncbi:MAG: HNH endonuclease [Bacteroidota bacterium]